MIKTSAKNKALLSVLLATQTMLALQAPGWCQSERPEALKLPKVAPQKTVMKVAPASTSEVLLVMPNASADVDETMSALKEVHGTVIGRIGDGEMTTLIVKTEKGHMAETEKKLSKDQHFAIVQRDYVAIGDMVNDPYIASEWHLGALNVVPAWQKSRGDGVQIAIADTGCQTTNPDLTGKLRKGFNTITGTNVGYADVHSSSHGTLVATAAAATTDNGKLTASPACRATVFPIVISNDGYTSDLKVAKAIYQAGINGCRVINISYGSTNAAVSYANPQYHPAVHAYLKWFYNRCNGLAFFAAGNEHQFDPNPRVPYLMMVTALTPNYGLASFSNGGNPVWFTAPGQAIYCSDRYGKAANVSGTSFASPLAASVAAMIISKKPTLLNSDVQRIMVNSCINAAGSKWNPVFGFGLPDADKALSLIP